MRFAITEGNVLILLKPVTWQELKEFVELNGLEDYILKPAKGIYE